MGDIGLALRALNYDGRLDQYSTDLPELKTLQSRGVSRAQDKIGLASRALSYNLDLAPLEPDPERGALNRGFRSGAAALGSMFGGFTSWTGDVVNDTDLQQWGADLAAAYQQDMQELGRDVPSAESIFLDAGEFDSFSEWLSSAASWAGYNVASGAVTSLPSLAVGLVAGAASPAVGLLGGSLVLWGMGVGEHTATQLEDQEDPHAGIAAAVGVPYALAERLLGAGSVLARTLTGKQKAAVARTFLRRLARDAPYSMASEAVAETAQTALTEGVSRLELGESFGDVYSDPNFRSALFEAATAGAIAGGPFGAVGALRGPQAQPQEPQRNPGARERAAQEEPEVTPEDEASPIDTDLIRKGKGIIKDAEVTSGIDKTLETMGFPPIGSGLTITARKVNGGEPLHGTVTDINDDEDGVFVTVEDDDGFEHQVDTTDDTISIQIDPSPEEKAATADFDRFMRDIADAVKDQANGQLLIDAELAREGFSSLEELPQERRSALLGAVRKAASEQQKAVDDAAKQGEDQQKDIEKQQEDAAKQAEKDAQELEKVRQEDQKEADDQLLFRETEAGIADAAKGDEELGITDEDISGIRKGVLEKMGVGEDQDISTLKDRRDTFTKIFKGEVDKRVKERKAKVKEDQEKEKYRNEIEDMIAGHSGGEKLVKDMLDRLKLKSLDDIPKNKRAQHKREIKLAIEGREKLAKSLDEQGRGVKKETKKPDLGVVEGGKTDDDTGGKKGQADKKPDLGVVEGGKTGKESDIDIDATIGGALDDALGAASEQYDEFERAVYAAWEGIDPAVAKEEINKYISAIYGVNDLRRIPPRARGAVLKGLEGLRKETFPAREKPDLGVVEGGKGKGVTEPEQALRTALEHAKVVGKDMEEVVQSIWDAAHRHFPDNADDLFMQMYRAGEAAADPDKPASWRAENFVNGLIGKSRELLGEKDPDSGTSRFRAKIEKLISSVKDGDRLLKYALRDRDAESIDDIPQVSRGAFLKEIQGLVAEKQQKEEEQTKGEAAPEKAKEEPAAEPTAAEEPKGEEPYVPFRERKLSENEANPTYDYTRDRYEKIRRQLKDAGLNEDTLHFEPASRGQMRGVPGKEFTKSEIVLLKNLMALVRKWTGDDNVILHPQRARKSKAGIQASFHDKIDFLDPKKKHIVIRTVPFVDRRLEQTLGHEVGHLLYRANIFTKAERALLDMVGLQLFDNFEMGRRYRGETFEMQIEESVVEAIGYYLSYKQGKETGAEFTPQEEATLDDVLAAIQMTDSMVAGVVDTPSIQSMLQKKLAELLEMVQNFIKDWRKAIGADPETGEPQTPTAKQLFEDIASGKIGERYAKSLQPDPEPAAVEMVEATEKEGDRAEDTQVEKREDRTDKVALVDTLEERVTPDGTEVTVRYGVIELADIVVSHDPDGKEMPNYPKKLQPRTQRSAQESIDQIRENSQESKYRPIKMMPGPDTDKGSPVLEPGLAVVTGNGRVIMAKIVYDREKSEGSEKAKELRERVLKWADRNGVGEQAQKMKDPIIVSIIVDEDVNLRGIAEESNDSDLLELSETETAKRDVSTIGGSTGESASVEALKFIANNSISAIRQRFIKNLGPNKRGSVVKSGALTQRGIERVNNAIFWVAWQSDKLQSMATELETEGWKRIINVMHERAHEAARVRNKGGDVETIVQGAEYYIRSKELGMNVEERLGMIDMFGGETTDTVEGEARDAAIVLATTSSEKQVDWLMRDALKELSARGKTEGKVLHKDVPLRGIMEKAVENAKKNKLETRPKMTQVVNTEGKTFKDWFKGSKVVDEDGEPLEVFHGTSAAVRFGKFSTDKRGTAHTDDYGYFFSSDEHIAQRYAESWRGEGANPRVSQAFLSIRNPYEMHSGDEIPAKYWFEAVETERHPEKTPWDVSMSDRLKEGKHDGVIVTSDLKDYEGNPIKMYMVLDPDQIQSAEPDGLFQRPKADPTDPEFKSWFKGSKVKWALMNDNPLMRDEPLVVFHGTVGSRFARFDPERIGESTRDDGIPDTAGFFFTTSEAYAQEWAEDSDRSMGARASAAYLALKKPLIVNSGDQGPTGWWYHGPRDEFGAPGFEQGAHRESLVWKAEKGGHDGIIVVSERHDVDGVKEIMLIAFDPDQIRSAETDGMFQREPGVRHRNDAATDEEIETELNRVGKEIFGDRFKVQVKDKLTDRHGRTVLGMYDRWKAMAIMSRRERGAMMNTLYHEGIHHLKASKAFTMSEWSTLRSEAKRKWIDRHAIRERYQGASEDVMVEEAIAEAFADFMGGVNQSNSTIQKIFERIRKFLMAIADWRGELDADEIFEKIARGDYADADTAAQVGGRGELFAKAVNTPGEPEFDKWFKGSKVKSKDGSPRVVSHGTASPKRFKKFSEKKKGATFPDRSGYFFTNNMSEAQGYADHHDMWAKYFGKKSDPRISGAYLSIKNPEKWNSGDVKPSVFWDYNRIREKVDSMKEAGRDGIIITSKLDLPSGEKETMWIAFESDQVRSAEPDGKFQRLIHRSPFEFDPKEIRPGVDGMIHLSDTDLASLKKKFPYRYDYDSVDVEFLPEVTDLGEWKPLEFVNELVERGYIPQSQADELIKFYMLDQQVDDISPDEVMSMGEEIMGAATLKLNDNPELAERLGIDDVDSWAETYDQDHPSIDDLAEGLIADGILTKNEVEGAGYQQSSLAGQGSGGNLTWAPDEMDARDDLFSDLLKRGFKAFKYRNQGEGGEGYSVAVIDPDILRVPPEQLEMFQRPKNKKEAFSMLASAQRGEPERRMLQVQRASGGGVLSHAVEHVGDLTHRMSEHEQFDNHPRVLVEIVKEKVHKTLRSLRSEYGFQRDHEENLRANARYRKIPLEDHTQKVNEALYRYAGAHHLLPVYNEMQDHARSAAIALGFRDWQEAIRNLEALEKAIGDTAKSREKFNERALEYDPEYVPRHLVQRHYPYGLFTGNGRRHQRPEDDDWISTDDDTFTVMPDAYSKVFEFESTQTEEKWAEAAKGHQDPLSNRVRGWFRNFGQSWVRTHRHLPRTAKFADAHAILRRVQAAPSVATEEVVRHIHGMIKDLSKQDRDLMTRRIVMDDFIHDVKRGLKIPFFATHDEFKAEYQRLAQEMKKRPDLMKRIRARQRYVNQVKDEMVKSGVMSEQQATNTAYYRHQVLAYFEGEFKQGKSARLRKAHVFQRKGTDMLINADLVQAESEWLFKGLVKVRAHKALDSLESRYSQTAWVRNDMKSHNDHVMRQHVLNAIKEMYPEIVTIGDFKEFLKENEREGRLLEVPQEYTDYMVFRYRIASAFTGIAGDGFLFEARDTIPESVRPAYNMLLARAQMYERLKKEESDDDTPDASEDIDWDAILEDIDYDANPFPLLKWILDNWSGTATGSAASIFKTISARRQHYKEILGDDYYMPWELERGAKTFRPDMVLWQPDPGNLIFAAHTMPEKYIDALERRLGEMVNDATDMFSAEELESVINEVKHNNARVLGPRKKQWVIPAELAATLDTFTDAQSKSEIDRFWRGAQRQWKVWALINPRNWLGYNLKNLSGDLDHVIAAFPSALKPEHIGPAMRELWDVQVRRKKPSALYLEAAENGVFDAGWAISEVYEAKSDISDLIGVKGATDIPYTALRKAWRLLSRSTTVRENIMRYAVYRAAKARIDEVEAAHPDWSTPDVMAEVGYGAANWKIVNATEDSAARAAWVARETLGDYGNISSAGEWMRSHAVPFWSWQEINMKFYARMTMNIVHTSTGFTRAQQLSTLGVRFGYRLGAAMVVRTIMLTTILYAWNHLLFPEEEEDLSEEDRLRIHLILGRNEDGSVNFMRLPGALSDALSWFGYDDAIIAANNIEKGRGDFTDIIAGIANAPINRVLNSVTPFVKAPFEMFTGRSLYPDYRQRRAIKDPWRHLTQSFAVENEYDALLGRPTKGYWESWLNRTVVRRDPGETAYNFIRGLGYDFIKDELGRDFSGEAYDPEARTLYYWRMAIRYEDAEAEARYLKELQELGVKGSRRQAAIKRMHPLGAIPRKYRRKFISTLAPDERSRLERAMGWFNRVF